MWLLDIRHQSVVKLVQSLITSVTNQPSVSDWVVQVPLWPSGLGVELWNRRPWIDTRTVRYIGGSGNPGSPVSGSSPPWLKVARARGLGFQKGGSSVTNQPSVSDWVVQVPLWPSGLGVELWNRRPGIDTLTVRYTSMAIFRYIGVSTNQELWAWLQHYLFMLVPFLGWLLS